MRVFLTFLLLLICFSPLNTFAECVKGDCVNGHGTMVYTDGSKYEGEFRNDKVAGQGTITYPDGSKYTGRWKDGRFNGPGTMIYPDGRKYVGEFRDGKRVR